MGFNLAYVLVADAAVSEPSRLLAGCPTVSWIVCVCAGGETMVEAEQAEENEDR